MKKSNIKFICLLAVRVLTILIGIVFVPVYVKIIGEESYGLVAFYGTLTGSLAILDMGLGTAIIRQVSILRTASTNQKKMTDLVFSVEVIYWGLALLAGIVIVALAPAIATYWVQAQKLSVASITTSVMLMGGVFAFSFPVSIYSGVLNSTENQLPNALIGLVGSIFKTVGVIFVLQYVAPTIETYFIWQIVVSFVNIIVFRYYTWRKLKTNQKNTISPAFSITEIKTLWRFAAGMTGISLITFFLAQIDKIVVSKYVTLDFVGYYSLAFTVSGGMTQFIAPLNPILFPKFSALVAQNKQQELIALYHRSCRWISIIVLPIGFTLILFAKDILLLWTNNIVLATHTAPMLQVVAAGSVCNSLMWIPYWYMLANGITKFAIYQNIIASIILVPLLFWWTGKYGALGASFVWLAVNMGYVLITIPIFHTFYLKRELKKWYLEDTLYPLIVVASLGFVLKYLQLVYIPDLTLLSFIAIGSIGLICYVIAMPDLRNYVRFQLQKYGK